MSARPRHRLLAALVAPAVAWFVFEEAARETAGLSCSSGASPLVPFAGGLALLICGGAAALAWPFVAGPNDDGRARRDAFIAGLALGGAIVFAVAVTLRALLGHLIPSCAA